MDNNTINSLLQSVSSNFQLDRDSAVSKINRLLESEYRKDLDVESELYQLFKDWALADLGIKKVNEAAMQMRQQSILKKQSQETQDSKQDSSESFPEGSTLEGQHKNKN